MSVDEEVRKVIDNLVKERVEAELKKIIPPDLQQKAAALKNDLGKRRIALLNAYARQSPL